MSGNIKRSAWALTSNYTNVILSMLPVPPKFKKKLKQSYRTAQQNRNQTVLKETLQIILEPLIAAEMNRIFIDGTELQCQECYS